MFIWDHRLTRLLVVTVVGLMLTACDRTTQDSNTKQPARASGVQRMGTVYVASPLGFADSTKSFMYKELIPAIENAGIRPINPWNTDGEVAKKIDKTKKIKNLDDRKKAWAEVRRLLGGANAEAIEKVDGLVAVLDGVDVDSGTAAEIGYAAALKKWIIGYRGDFRRTGEDEASIVNLQVEYFILKNGGVIVHTISDLGKELKERSKKGKE